VEKHWSKARLRLCDEHDSSQQVSLCGHEPGPLWLRWLGRLRLQRTVAWVRTDEDAVYELTTHSLAKHPVLPEDFTVGSRENVQPCS
jgi:hypothetical protein